MIGYISQDETDPVKRIAAFIGHVKDLTIYEGNSVRNHPMNLLSQCLQLTATFLNAHPDLIDSFLETVDLSSSPSDTPFPNRSSTKHSLSPRSFTDPASSFIRMASTNPVFFRHLVETHAGHILNLALSTAVRSVRVVYDSPSEPHCLDFGRATPNWVVLLKAIAEVRMDLTQNQKDFNSLPSSLLTFLVLFAASTHDELSATAVSVFSNQFGLSTPHTEALLFATPTTFPVSDAFTIRPFQASRESDHTRRGTQSICAEAGRCAELQSRSDISEPFESLDFARNLGIHFAGSLVIALHSTATLPHYFPFFSPELSGLSEKPSVWNDSSQPSAVTALTTLADIEISLAYSRPHWQPKMSETDDARRDTILIHLFPFLGPESQIQFLSLLHLLYGPERHGDIRSLDRIVEFLVEMATVDSVNTPIALLKEMRKVARLVFRDYHRANIYGNLTPHTARFETSIVEKLRTTEGEERWKLLTQLSVVSNDTPDITNELMRAENDAQALFVLSVHTIQSTPRPNLYLDWNLAAFDRLVELAGRFNNLPLVAEALFHFGNSVGELTLPPLAMRLIEPNPDVRDNVINTLRAIAPLRREGVEEGCAVGKDDDTSQIVDSCCKLLRFLLKTRSFDPTPVIDSLVSLAVTTDLSLIHSILVVLLEIEERTRNTPTPFSISRATAPFRGIHESSVTQQPLPSIVAPILLSASLEEMLSLSRSIRERNETLLSVIATETAKTICLVLEKRRASSSQALKSDDQFGISPALTDRHTTPQQLFLTLHTMIFPSSTADIPASTLLPLAPFFTRILTIVVPSSPDRVEIRRRQDNLSHLLNSFLSLVLSIIHTPHPSSLSTPPLSSLLSVLSIALVRLDRIPSSLDLFNRFNDLFEKRDNRSNPRVKQFVLALSSEGMEDRSDLAPDSFSLDFLNKWKGANAQRHVDRLMPVQRPPNPLPQPNPRLLPHIHHVFYPPDFQYGPHNGIRLPQMQG
ncbi:hypothetical protein BLNAU_23940 [Blattamonas nauphoetae]|uniref:Uncharacterized protein n=1 Tax=Blattamonas nauphoetae TaxID=2049346 RepID=A0ABQ9WNT9_9EUKA|nr:hypothetical protein BLNAU_23940 [Blattamonas nauphoetae]